MSNVLNRIQEARARLLMDRPFFAFIALGLKLKESTEVPTMGTDSVVLVYNPEFVNTLQKIELIGLICHEVMHIVLGHPFRKKNRNHELWNMACDYAINLILDDEGFSLPKGGLLDSQFRDMSAEEIYQKLLDNPPSEKDVSENWNVGEVKDYKQGGEEGYSSSLSEQEKMVKGNVTVARMFSPKMSQTLKKVVDEYLEHTLPWREILARFVTQSLANDYTWTFPNKRYAYNGLYLPTLKSPALMPLAICVDTSGSVGSPEITLLLSELRGILSCYPEAVLDVFYADTAVVHEERVTVNDLALEPKGGGGTSYIDAINKVKDRNEHTAILYFTDGYCDRFPDDPMIPVLWILTPEIGGYRREFNPPFGEVLRVQAELS